MLNATSCKAKVSAAVGPKPRMVAARAGKYDEELMQTAVRPYFAPARRQTKDGLAVAHSVQRRGAHAIAL